MAPDLFSPTYGPSMPALRSCRLGPVLCGLVLIGGLLGAGLSAHESRAEQSATEVRQQAPPSQDSATTVSGEGSTPSVPETDSAGESVIEFLLEIFILGPIITILLGLLLAFPTVLLSVSLVMDGGCLRFILFGIGWLSAIIYGAFTGMIVGEAILGLEFLVKPIFHLFMWGYPVAAVWGHRKLEAMPEEQYRAWDQTLTGGALLGFGAGSIAGLARSVASGFGGYGGGSFGGGGASGSWSGATSAAGGTSSTAAGGASSTATGAATTGAGGSSQAAAVAAGATPGVADEASSSAASEAPQTRGFWNRLRQWFQKFQWYHGLAFVLVTLVFVPLGLGTMQALQNTKFFVFALVCVLLYSGYKLLHRYPNAPDAVASKISSFRGGESSSSWS